jgi:oxygen-independent coproporphyrinogen-3 oxidase
MFCYIHIPFCENKCMYCKFASVWITQSDKIKKYVDYLISQINNSNKKINRLKSNYFWWWTPSTILVNDLENIINTLKNKFWFEKNIEITLETTPNKVTENTLVWWKNIWINRLSVWVQTLNNKSLIEIWRGNKWDIIDALNVITKVWLSNISLDFIIWLPYVKKWELNNNINYLLNNYDFIKHISVYMLEDHYYPWNWKKISINEDDYLWEYIEVKKILWEKWFNRYEISNFSKPWFECNHNQAYWNHSEMLAFWLWSHWFLDWIRISYPDNFKDYYNDKVNYEETLNNDDLFLEKVMFWLRTSWLDEDICNKLDNKKIQDLIESWYLKMESNILKLEDKGILVQDFILGEIV